MTPNKFKHIVFLKIMRNRGLTVILINMIATPHTYTHTHTHSLSSVSSGHILKNPNTKPDSDISGGSWTSCCKELRGRMVKSAVVTSYKETRPHGYVSTWQNSSTFFLLFSATWWVCVRASNDFPAPGGHIERGVSVKYVCLIYFTETMVQRIYMVLCCKYSRSYM